MKDTYKTKVNFYITKNQYTRKNEVMAVFTESAKDCNFGHIMSYNHCGQHSECSFAYIETLKLATEKQYKDLYNELENIVDYDLEVLKESFIRLNNEDCV